jgi:deazaflavin-dependent oxidoreductase (nitroreductase family)
MTRLRRIGRAASTIAVGAVIAEAVLVHLGRTYGSTRAERDMRIPGDDVVARPVVVTNHAITIDAPPSDVWPWLVQMGWGRAGWYTAGWVDRLLFPANGPSATAIFPALQQLEVGDFVPDGPPRTNCGFIVEELIPNRALVLHSTSHLPASWRDRAVLDWSWAFHLTPLNDGARTRYLFRSRWTTSPWWLTLSGWLGIVPADFVMSRDHLHGVRSRSSRSIPQRFRPRHESDLVRDSDRSGERASTSRFQSAQAEPAAAVGAEELTVATPPPAREQRRRRGLLGVRGVPGRLALAVFRSPLRVYRHGWGWLLGRTFLVLVHVGRTTGRPHETVAMVLADDRDTGELVICSAWGPDADWVRNLHAGPAREVRVGRDCFVPLQRFLTEDEAVAVADAFRHRHPWRLRLISGVLGWGDLGSDDAMRTFTQQHPFVALRPTPSPMNRLEEHR